MSHGGPMTVERQAEMLKDRGNTLFKKDRLGPAIEAYTEAIALCPRKPVYWTNRALCHRKREDWKQVESDCRKALELDNYSVKAHYMLGLALLQRERLEEAIVQLEKALELGRSGQPGNYMVEEIWQELAKAKYIEWERRTMNRKHQQEELREFCETLLREDYKRRMNEALVKSTSTKGVEIDGVIHLDDDASDSGSNEIREIEPAKDPKVINEQYNSRLETLGEVFRKAGAPDHPAEVPDHLQCKITMDIFRDPVITPSGITYEKAVLLEHLRKVGKFDPMNRAPLQPEQIVPNLALKEALQSYLNDHGWAYKIP
ncbi:unnamed protein product [Calypogeia fissa]